MSKKNCYWKCFKSIRVKKQVERVKTRFINYYKSNKHITNVAFLFSFFLCTNVPIFLVEVKRTPLGAVCGFLLLTFKIFFFVVLLSRHVECLFAILIKHFIRCSEIVSTCITCSVDVIVKEKQ
jgi:hypothetical protein